MTPVRTVARAMLAGIFVAGGAKALTNPDPLVPGAKRVTDRVAPLLTKVHEKAPTDARTLVRLNGAVQVAGGLLLVTRMHRLGALALVGSVIPTTMAGHRFWEIDDPEQRQHQQVQFLKNLGLLGGLLLAAADTGGEPSLGWRAAHLAHHADRAVRRRATELRRHLPG